MKHFITSSFALWLVAFCVLACAGNTANGTSDESETISSPETAATAQHDAVDPIVITLKELFEDKNKFAGKLVQVTGQCVKINKNIMGLNWAHIRDGSDPEEDYDLTVTTSADVPVDQEVTMVGKIVIDKDFGSGYRYDILMEDGQLK